MGVVVQDIYKIGLKETNKCKIGWWPLQFIREI
jgi:hypothetical protein